MSQIVPAILEQTKEKFLEKMSLVTKIPGVERIQVDFGDGVFVENKLLPAASIDPLNPAFAWEAHLMVQSPSDFLDYQICGFQTIIMHYEAFPSEEELKKTLREVKAMGFKTGVAINPATTVDVLHGLEADQYLIMGVVPGEQGRPFLPATIQRVKELRRLLPHAIIEVDGGIHEANIKSVKDAGADLICVGSALVRAPDINTVHEHLMEQVS